MQTKAHKLGITEFPYYEYNEKGKITYFERKDGYWWRAEYNQKGFETLVEFFDGMFVKREFDNKNRQIYCEISSGVIQDDRGIIIKAGRPKKTN
jgi:hypothetical protein